MHPEAHGIRARLDDGQDFCIANLLAQTVQRGFDSCGVMSKIVVNGNAVFFDNDLHAAFDIAKRLQGFYGGDRLNSDMAGCGDQIPKDMQGRSMTPLLGGEAPDDWRTSIYYHYYEGEGRVHNAYKHYGVRTDRYKLVYFWTLDEWELYDHETDPTEMMNQYANPEYAKVVAELKAELERLREQYAVTEDEPAR